MKNILIYYQNPYRTIFLESFVQKLIAKGFTVHFLSKCERGILQDLVEKYGAITTCYNPKKPRFFRFFYHIFFLIKYCRKNKIDVVYSHLQLANLIALVAQYFIKAKVIPCRHHLDAVFLEGNKNSIRIDKMVNRFSKKIVVVSDAAKQFMVKNENIKEEKLHVIPLGYDFELYDKPDRLICNDIRKNVDREFVMLIVSRMVVNKRHMIAFDVLNTLVKEGFCVKMFVLDAGPELTNLQRFVVENNLINNVIFTGFLNNIMDYVEVADILLHPSISESSNQVVKEAGYLEKPSIVCSGVGDFDEYIVNGENGFLVSKENTVSEMTAIVREYYFKKDELKKMGTKLKQDVLQKFDIEKVVEQYLKVAKL